MTLAKVTARMLWVSVAVTGALFLMFWAQLAASSRLASDDFCLAGVFRHSNILDAVLWWRAHHSGRWFSQGFAGLVCNYFLPNGRTLPYSLGLFMALAVASVWALSGWDASPPRENHNRTLGPRVLLALFWLAVIFALTPTPSEVWFWIAGSAVHTIPIVALLLLIGVLARGTMTTPHVTIAAIAAIVVGGCSETAIVLGIVGVTSTAIRATGERRRLAIIGALCLFCSAAFALSAPGNFTRLNTQTAHAALRPQDFLSAITMAWHVGFVMKWHWWLLLCGVSLGLAPTIEAHFPQLRRSLGSAFWIGIPLTCAISLSPAIVAFHGLFPARPLAPITFFAAIWVGVACINIALRLLDANRWLPPALEIMGTGAALGIALLFALWIRSQTPFVQSTARTFDLNYALIRASRPGCPAVLKVEKPVWQRWVPIGVPEPSPTHWISHCMSDSLDSCPLSQK